MAPCPAEPTFNHSALIEGARCPMCKCSTTASSSGAPQQPTGIGSQLTYRSQYTPVTASAITAVRQITGNGNTARSQSITSTRTSIPASVTQHPRSFKFTIRVAHANYEGDPPKTSWTVWTEGWTVAILANSVTSYWELKETFRSQGQSQNIPYLNAMTSPDGYGHWSLTNHHLDSKSPNIQLFCTWVGEMPIEEIISTQDFKMTKGISAYPVTLLWFPEMKDPDCLSFNSGKCALCDDLLPAGGSPSMPFNISDSDSVDLPSLKELLAPSAPTQIQVKDKAKTGHKRQISDAIPRAEREVARAPVVLESKEGDTQEGTRRSGRVRKPKSRD